MRTKMAHRARAWLRRWPEPRPPLADQTLQRLPYALVTGLSPQAPQRREAAQAILESRLITRRDKQKLLSELARRRVPRQPVRRNT